MKLNMLVMYFCCLLYTQKAYANNDTLVVNINGRELMEIKHVGKSNYYVYSIRDIVEHINTIKNTKEDFSKGYGSLYPAYRDEQLFHNEMMMLRRLRDNCLTNNITGLSPADILWQMKILVENNGNVWCKKLYTEMSLFDLFTYEQILNIFDTLCNFKFTAPVLASPPHPEDCYIEF